MADTIYSLIHKTTRHYAGQTRRPDTEPAPTPPDANYEYIADVITDGDVVPGAISPRDANPPGAVTYLDGSNSFRQATAQEQTDRDAQNAADEAAKRKASRRAQYDDGGAMKVLSVGLAAAFAGVVGAPNARQIAQAIQAAIDAE